MTLVVGIPACTKLANGHIRHEVLLRYSAAVLGGAGAIPVLLPPMGAAELPVLERLDGLLLPGSPSNVHPTHYAGGESETPEFHDADRDATTLPLIRAAIGLGLPMLAICRGHQELNVALGGSLHQRVHLVEDRLDHRGGLGSVEEQYGPKHKIALAGRLAEIVGATDITVNSLHGQAIDRLAPGLAVEAVAPDGTIEGVRYVDTPGFVMGVQWHPEWGYQNDAASLALFGAFGAACRAWRARPHARG
jgi:putative glutamine amidotransferase